MITDGYVLPDRFSHFDKRFDLSECLFAFRSFLRNYKVGKEPFDVFFTKLCTKENINPRIMLAFLQYGGLLSRKSCPPEWLVKKALPVVGAKKGDFGMILERSVGDFRNLLDYANTTDPLQVIDGAILPKTRLSYALFMYVPEKGTKEYPDTGMFKYIRFFNQLNRFVRRYS